MPSSIDERIEGFFAEMRRALDQFSAASQMKPIKVTPYDDCVRNCNDLFKDNQEALLACIEGCARVHAPSARTSGPADSSPF